MGSPGATAVVVDGEVAPTAAGAAATVAVGMLAVAGASVRLRPIPRASSTLVSTAPALPTLSSVMLRLIPGATAVVDGEVATMAVGAVDTLDGATVDTLDGAAATAATGATAAGK